MLNSSLRSLRPLATKVAKNTVQANRQLTTKTEKPLLPKAETPHTNGSEQKSQFKEGLAFFGLTITTSAFALDQSIKTDNPNNIIIM
jgi:hypothetical protein